MRRLHQLIDVLYFSEGTPAAVLAAPTVSRPQPNSKCLGKILCGMGLSIPGIEIQHVIPAAGLWLVPFRVRYTIGSEGVLPASTGMQSEGIVYRVSGFMPQDSHTFAFAGAFNLQHLRSLEFHQSWMRQIKGNSKTRDAIRRKPFFTEPDMRFEIE
jgi:hypothetical protein